MFIVLGLEFKKVAPVLRINFLEKASAGIEWTRGSILSERILNYILHYDVYGLSEGHMLLLSPCC
jgi:hypothetical protein